jgi:hypothetical protein
MPRPHHRQAYSIGWVDWRQVLGLVSAGDHFPDYHGGVSLATFVLRYLPPAPARVLEIGCGSMGDLTYAIAAGSPKFPGFGKDEVGSRAEL